MILIRKKKNEMKPQTNQGVNPRKTADGERCNLQRMKLRLTTNKEVTDENPNLFHL
jgi:hypothetical protein